MPTSRKRIGFLPSKEIQDIIDEISVKNNLSQSKVTGILVEEALNARNLYNQKRKYDLKDIEINAKIKNKTDNLLPQKNIDLEQEKEYKLVKEYLNYKNFKTILSKVQSENKRNIINY